MMKNIQVIDGADNCTYDVFAIEDEDFKLFFPEGQDIEFIDDLLERLSIEDQKRIFDYLWKNRVPKLMVQGIHGTLFYELGFKKRFYPTKKDEEMVVVL